MVDFSFVDVLIELFLDIEGEIKWDFIVILEVEVFDDVVGEIVGKIDYIFFLDVDEKIGNLELKKKLCLEIS